VHRCQEKQDIATNNNFENESELLHDVCVRYEIANVEFLNVKYQFENGRITVFYIVSPRAMLSVRTK
jgi:hypothetical protein